MSSSAAAEVLKPIDAIRKVLSERKLVTVDGMSIDEVTAKMIVKVYDGGSAKRREKLDKLSIKKLVVKAFEISGNA